MRHQPEPENIISSLKFVAFVYIVHALIPLKGPQYNEVL